MASNRRRFGVMCLLGVILKWYVALVLSSSLLLPKKKSPNDELLVHVRVIAQISLRADFNLFFGMM